MTKPEPYQSEDEFMDLSTLASNDIREASAPYQEQGTMNAFFLGSFYTLGQLMREHAITQNLNCDEAVFDVFCDVAREQFLKKDAQ